MLSLVCLPVFIILVYVSGSTINDIEILSTSQVKDTGKTFITTTTTSTLATPITTPSLTQTEKSTISSGYTSSSSLLLGHSGIGTLQAQGQGFQLLSSPDIRIQSPSLQLRPTGITEIITTTTTKTEAPSRIISRISLTGKLPIENTFETTSTLSSITSTPTVLRIFPKNNSTPATIPLSTIIPETTTTTIPDDSRRINNHNNVGIGYLNITSQAGTHAYLPCNVKQLVKKPVSWIRVRDGHILTVDQTTFIADQRFQSIYIQNPERWSLQIKYVQTRDAGSYECQVSTEPKMSARVSLYVIEPKTEIVGESNRHVKAGSRVILRCIVSGALEPPLFINWYFDKKQIYLHNQNGWRNEIDREFAGNNNDKQNTIASLIIPSVTKKDSGNYTCSPSNSESITFVLHVLNGEYSASAITSNGDILKQSLVSIIIICLQLFIKI